MMSKADAEFLVNIYGPVKKYPMINLDAILIGIIIGFITIHLIYENTR